MKCKIFEFSVEKDGMVDNYEDQINQWFDEQGKVASTKYSELIGRVEIYSQTTTFSPVVSLIIVIIWDFIYNKRKD